MWDSISELFGAVAEGGIVYEVVERGVYIGLGRGIEDGLGWAVGWGWGWGRGRGERCASGVLSLGLVCYTSLREFVRGMGNRDREGDLL